MGLDISVVRQNAIVPNAKLRDFLADLVKTCDRVDIVDDEEKDSWKPPKVKKELRAAINEALDAYGFRCSFGKSGDVSVEMSDRWYDEMMDVLKSLSRNINGEGYFVLYEAGDIWRYQLCGGEVYEQSVAGILWSQGKDYCALREIDLDIDIDSCDDAEKLKEAIP